MSKRSADGMKRREVLQQGTLVAAAALAAPPLARAATEPKVTTMVKQASADMTAEDIRKLLELEPNATCGFVRVTFLSKQKLAAGALPAPFAAERPLGSALYFLVTPEAPVRLHRIRNDQLYHYYLGDPLELFLLHAGGAHERVVVGPDLAAGERVQLLIPGGTFHTARLIGKRWFLGASTEWPGVVPADVEIGNVEAMAAKYADISADIRAIAASVRYVPPKPGAPR